MEKMTVDEFWDKVSSIATRHFGSAWSEYCNTEKVGARSFRVSAYHKWGTAYCDYSWRKDNFFCDLYNAGATGIKGKVEWNRVDVLFDMKKSLIKKEENNA